MGGIPGIRGGNGSNRRIIPGIWRAAPWAIGSIRRTKPAAAGIALLAKNGRALAAIGARAVKAGSSPTGLPNPS
jgi:hypothetical protein